MVDYLVPGRVARRRTLANFLLVKAHCASEQSQGITVLGGCSAILWAKESEPLSTWGIYSRFLGDGSGSNGVCSTTWIGIPCAWKEFHEIYLERVFLKEASILAHLKHPYIVSFLYCGNGLKEGHRFIAMELMEMSLSDLIKEQKQKAVYFSLPVVVDIMVQTARGMCYLHDQGVAHRDLKPQNVLVNKITSPHLKDYFDVKLVDFGVSKIKVQGNKANTISDSGVGTTIYRAPEVHPKSYAAYPDGKGKAIWFKADVVSFALTCAHLLSLKQPFEDILLSRLYDEVIITGQRPELPINCPEELVELLQKCWVTDPHKRPSFEEVSTKARKI